MNNEALILSFTWSLCRLGLDFRLFSNYSRTLDVSFVLHLSLLQRNGSAWSLLFVYRSRDFISDVYVVQEVESHVQTTNTPTS